GQREVTERTLDVWAGVIRRVRVNESPAVSFRVLSGEIDERNVPRNTEWVTQLDGWGHPVIYACPGPIHRFGFDLISCGPNGLYEAGAGDDIVRGAETASIFSGSTPTSPPTEGERLKRAADLSDFTTVLAILNAAIHRDGDRTHCY